MHAAHRNPSQCVSLTQRRCQRHGVRSLLALEANPTKPESLNLHRVTKLDPLVTGRFALSMVHDELQCRAPSFTTGKHDLEHRVVFCSL